MPAGALTVTTASVPTQHAIGPKVQLPLFKRHFFVRSVG